MVTKTDARQIISRDTLSRLTGAAGSQVDDILRAANSEVTPPLAVSCTGTDLNVSVSSVTVANPDTNLNRTIPPISSIIPNFSSATVTFPSSGTGTITTTAGSATLTLAMSASQQMLVALSLDANGNIQISGGTPAASITAPFTVPTISGLLLFAFIIISTNGSNVVQNITKANLYQVPVGGGGSGTGNANTILETLKNQLVDSPYQLVTPNIVSSSGQSLFSSITGAAYDVVTNTIKFTADSQTAVSTNQLDSTEFLPQSLIVGSADLSAFWNRGSSFATPTSKTFTNSAASVSNTSATVTLTIPNHGLTSGKKIYVQTSSAIGGISAANLSGNSITIASVPDANTITYTAGATASSTATGSIDFVISGFVFLGSRDGGTNYYPFNMSRVGTTEAFYGSLQWGQSQTTEALGGTTLGSAGGGTTGTFVLGGSVTAAAALVTVPANTNWVINQVQFNIGAVTGSPTGNLFVELYSTSAGVPSTVLATSNPIAASGLSAGQQTVTFPTTVLAGGTAGTTYAFVVTGDATYLAGAGGNFQLQRSSTVSSTETLALWQLISGTWTQVNTVNTLTNVLGGYKQDLRVKIFSASDTNLTYPVGLDGYGIFYNLQNSGVVGTTKKSQRFVFNSVTDNSNSFTINTFVPDPDLLNCYWVEGGQVFKAPAFAVNGNVVTFPANTFNQGGVSQTITLIFDQNTGGAFDNSDLNAQLLAASHLGSTNGAIDKSSAGRGILLRNAAGVLVELTLDASNNIVILSTT